MRRMWRFYSDYIDYSKTFILSNIIVDIFLDLFGDEEIYTFIKTLKNLDTVYKFSCMLSSQNIRESDEFGMAHQSPLFLSQRKRGPEKWDVFSRSHSYLVAELGLEFRTPHTRIFLTWITTHSEHSEFILNYGGKSLEYFKEKSSWFTLPL